MIILLLFAFLAGVVTVLSPCILPVLPIILSGSIGGGHRRPFGVITGFVLSFTFFTLFLSTIVRVAGISADALRTFSVVVIVGFGIGLLIPQFQVLLEKLFSKLSQFVPTSSTPNNGFFSGLLIGFSLGLLWTPCVGPILASVISLALTGSVNSAAVFITLAYALGTALPMLAITYGGRSLLAKVPWLVRNTGTIQKAFGVIMIATGLAIFFNVDRQFQAWVLERFPQYGAGLTQLEDVDAVKQQLEEIMDDGDMGDQDRGKPMFIMQDEMQMAPELLGGTGWINSDPLTLEELRGKVVLVDFWTYSCINCIRTFPYLKQWYEKYKDDGFVIVGVHSPEFEFEKNRDNVIEAMADYGLEYPVVQDNDFAIWRAYNNRFWPAHYLVDKNGIIRYEHFGEGKYLETENKIRELLDEQPLQSLDTTLPDEVDFSMIKTRETYLGHLRAESYLEEQSPVVDAIKNYEWPLAASTQTIPAGGVVLEGDWEITPEAAIAHTDNARLNLNFQAGQVHLVLAPGENGPSQVLVLLDGQSLTSDQLTADTDSTGRITVDEARKYDLVKVDPESGRHVVTLVTSDGVEAYAFTFGS